MHIFVCIQNINKNDRTSIFHISSRSSSMLVHRFQKLLRDRPKRRFAPGTYSKGGQVWGSANNKVAYPQTKLLLLMFLEG